MTEKIKYCAFNDKRICNDDCVAFNMWSGNYNCKRLKNTIDFETVTDKGASYGIISGKRN